MSAFELVEDVQRLNQPHGCQCPMCAANVIVEMMSFDELLTSLQNCVIAEDQKLERVFDKLSECSRSDVKRTKERILDEAAQLLKTVNLHVLARDHLELVVRLLVCLQLQMVHISTACRKVDQMLQCLAMVDHQLVFGEIHACLSSIVHSEQIFSHEHLQRACMFLEVSSVGRDVWRELCPAFLDKMAKFFPLIVQQEPLRDGQLCYMAVKVCLQIFQLLSREVSFAVWGKKESTPAIKKILQVLAEIIFGQSCSRDTRLLAGTAMAMLINTASESSAGAAAAWSLFQSSQLEPWLLTVGTLQVQCCPTSGGALGQLAMSRGLLTCCQPHILLSSCAELSLQGSLLLDALFPLLYDLCEEKLNCHYLAFEVFTLWLKKVKECVPDIWKMTGGRFLPDDSNLQQKLISVIWTGAESPVEGVSDCARVTFSLLLDLYDMDCEQFGDTNKPLYLTLLHRIIQLPWESKAKFHRLCALLPYLGTDTVLDHYAEIPNHLLKCMSNDHLSPCGSELYKCLIQQQRKELSGDTLKSLSESDLGNKWAERWLPVLLEALTSNIVILQNNSSTHLLPCTFQVFPSAVEPLLASLDPFSTGHLCAWAFIMSSYRAVTGSSPWVLQGSSTLKILQLALGSADDNIRLAALNLLCCSLKTKEIPTSDELSIMRTFIPQNLNSESSLFRQHFQAAARRFLVRIRDGCLAHIKQQKGKGNSSQMESSQEILALGIGFVDWLSQLVCCNLTPNHSYQRKKTVLLLLSALLETCTDTWSPDKKKGQPPVDMGSLLTCATSRGQWDFFSREKLLVLISCLEDSTNEIRELSAGLLVRFFPSVFPADVAAALLVRTKQLLCSPRVQEAQMGALMMKVLYHKWQGLLECKIISAGASSVHNIKASSFARFLVNELKDHYLTAKADVMLSARTKPMHGVLSALQKCLLDDRCSISDSLGSTLISDLLSLLKNISLLLLGMLHGQQETESDAPPSFCDMGNAISSLIAHASEENLVDGGEECVLLSEEHSLVLTCCWVSLKETGILLGSLVEKILSESKPDTCFLTKQQLETASAIFRLILLKCRHWGAVEGCSVGFTRYCSALLSSSEPELRDIPSQMLQQALQVVQSPSCTSVTRRAAGLPMLILCVVSAEEPSTARPLLAHTMQTLLDTARIPLPENWDQTLDLPQVCAVHTLQALVRGSSLGVAILQFAPSVAILALTLLSSPCWAMRNAALQLYSSLCSRMLGQRPSSEGGTKYGMSPHAFFHHYSTLQLFLLEELREAASDLQCPTEEARLRLQPSLFPILTLLSQLQPGVQDSTETLADFLPPLLQLSASPVYSVRVMASKALVAMTPPSEYVNILINLTARLPCTPERCCHNWLHGQLLHIKAVLDRTLGKDCVPAAELHAAVSTVETSLWLATDIQRCPLVRAAYVNVVESLRRFCCETFLSMLFDVLIRELRTPKQGLQVGLFSFHQRAIQLLGTDPKWAPDLLETLRTASCDLRLTLVTWVVQDQDHASLNTHFKELIQSVLQSGLREALLSPIAEYRRAHVAAFVGVMATEDPPPQVSLEESVLLECLDLLLRDLEDQRGGSEFLSRALHGASLLLSQCSQDSLIQRWCGVMETHRSPHAAEVLRISCAEALCVAGLPLTSHNLIPPTLLIKLLNTGLYLLQDQSQQVRTKAARFISMLHHARGGGPQRRLYLMQVNLAIPLLLELLLEECWDITGTLQVLLCHVPHSDLRSVLSEIAVSGCGSLYEQDDANVFAEPSVMSEYVLPYLLLMAEKYSESSALAQRLSTWAEENAAPLLDNLTLCKSLQPAEMLTLLTDPRFHNTLCGLLTRATFLLHLSKTCDRLQHLCDPSALQMTLKDICTHLSEQEALCPHKWPFSQPHESAR
ncbi:thyroid adenoma-associated protein homolog isoform X2 [Hippocampus zosterae]|uniref:thyroid adenoma-associated protein homolog isoform X2 n=1 Tax=Hippocampus zosterae TaxID=109293 RepID=UPI00223D1AC4|nr:thyroid adenoma-associated protein homolog isoform X2 [Hippocampus zosterae]